METEKEYEERMRQMIAKRIEDNKHLYGIVKLEKVERDLFQGWYYDSFENIPNDKFCQCKHPRPGVSMMCSHYCGDDENYFSKPIINKDENFQKELEAKYITNKK